MKEELDEVYDDSFSKEEADADEEVDSEDSIRDSAFLRGYEEELEDPSEEKRVEEEAEF